MCYLAEKKIAFPNNFSVQQKFLKFPFKSQFFLNRFDNIWQIIPFSNYIEKKKNFSNIINWGNHKIIISRTD